MTLLNASFAEAASLTVVPESAFAGGFGLAVVVGDTCTAPDTRVLAPPPAQVEGLFEGCLEVTASGLEITGAGATFRAGEAITLGEGFTVAAGTPFTAALDPGMATPFASVAETSPIAETDYHAVFYLSTDELALTAGDAVEHFAGYSAAGEAEFVLTLRENPGGVDSLHLAAVETGGGVVQMTAGQELPLAPGWNRIEIDWKAGAGDGALLVSVNDGPFEGLTGLTNGDRRVETVRWGAIGGTVTTSAGTLRVDGFDSWR